MTKSRTFLAVALAGITTAALAQPTFVPTFNTTYKIKPTSKIGKAMCAACHIGMGPKNNAYGNDLHKAMGKSKVLTAAMLKKIEALDSDKDGVKNLAEIKADTLPGDPKSKPAKSAKAKKTKK